MEKVQMKNKLKGLAALFVASTLMIGVGVSLISQDVLQTEAADQTIALNNIGASAPASASSTIGQVTVSGYVLNYYQVKKQTSGSNHAMFLTKGVSPFIGNKTPISGHIKSIDVSTLTGSSGKVSYRVNFDSAEYSAPGTAGTAVVIGAGKTYKFTNTNTSGDNYFAISLGNNENGQVQNITITYEEATVNTVVTSLAVDPTTKSLSTTSVLSEADYSVLITKDGAAGNSEDYTAQIGTGTGTGFSGKNIIWGTTTPEVSDTTIQFKAKHPTTSGGSTYLTAEVALTVTPPNFSTATYSISAKNTFTVSGSVPSGSSASLVETYTGASKQITNGNSQTVTLSNYTNIKISKITLSARSNADAGAGSLSYSLNGGSSFTNIIADSNFNTSGWYGAWSTSYVNVSKNVDITVNSSVIFKVSASKNSIYVGSYDIQWEEAEIPDLSSIAVSGAPIKTSYYDGDNFDPTGITVNATYSDGNVADVTENCTYTPSPLTQGTTSVTVSYEQGGITKTTTISGITVAAPLVLSSIEVSGSLAKTTYFLGDTFDPTGITVTAKYTNGTTVDVTSSCTYSPSPLTLGATSVTVSYSQNGLTETAEISGITVNTAPEATVVKFGNNEEDNNWTENAQILGSDYIGLATLSHYVSTTAETLFGVNRIINSSFSVEFKVGSYGSWPTQATMPTITVALLDSNNAVLSSASGSPTITGSNESYVQGMKIIVAKPANPELVASVKISVSAVGSMSTSAYMRLQELTLEFATLVLQGKALSNIVVTTQPTNKSYFNGESFNPSGMVITATYDDGSEADVTSSCTYTPSPLITGTTSVLITYIEGEITQTTSITGITVIDRMLNGISIKTASSKLLFTLGEQFSYPRLVVDANWNNGTIELTDEFTVTGVDTLKLGVQTATISYLDKTATYSVKVTNQNAKVGEVAVINELFISEYYEGAGSDKYIEIYNGTSSSINLSSSNYSLKVDANGAGNWNASNIALTGTISAYSTYIVAHSSSNTSILALANQTQASLTHNGNDSIGLFKGTNLIDVFGIFGNNPGTGWDIGEIANATLDHVVVRKSSVTSPTTTWNTDEWEVYNNTLDYCGSHTVSTSDVTSLQQATAFANYVMTGIGLNAQGECSGVLEALLEEYYYMDEESILEFETAPEEIFVNARDRLSYLQAWVNANSPQGLAPSFPESTYSSTIFIIASLGIGTVLAYFLIRKKKVQ